MEYQRVSRREEDNGGERKQIPCPCALTHGSAHGDEKVPAGHGKSNNVSIEAKITLSASTNITLS
jgi:hypothetical protein